MVSRTSAGVMLETGAAATRKLLVTPESRIAQFLMLLTEKSIVNKRTLEAWGYVQCIGPCWDGAFARIRSTALVLLFGSHGFNITPLLCASLPQKPGSKIVLVANFAFSFVVPCHGGINGFFSPLVVVLAPCVTVV